MPATSRKPAKHPYHLPPRLRLSARLYHPSTAGVLTATLATVCPRPSLPRYLGNSLEAVLGWTDAVLPSSVLGIIPRRVRVVVAAFTCGYVSFVCADWLRWRVYKRLLGYQGWMYNPGSLKTKVWGVMLKILRGTGICPTYSLQSLLPKQPLPDLDQTLDRWLAASQQLVSEEEYEDTKAAVESFRTNEGPKLQAYLKHKAQTYPSWLADYWLTAAYLANRDPLEVNNNYFITTGFPLGEKKPDFLSRAATWIHNMAKFDEMLCQQMLPPLTMLTVPMCMNGFRHIFGTVRTPGEHMDTIVKYNEKHIIVIRRSNYFKLDICHKGKHGRQGTLLTPEELQNQLQRICEMAEELPLQPPVAALTSQNRSLWTKQRERLQERNQVTLHDVESSMFIFCLDESAPKDVHEFCKILLTGDGSGNDRWYDKCFTGVIFSDAMMGFNVEHTGLDATVFAILIEYGYVHEHYKDGKILSDPCKPARSLVPPQRIQWDLTGLEEEVKVATEHSKYMGQDLDLYIYPFKYGKGFMKKQRISPDGYIQMMMQLAYYRIYKSVPKTYEPSTGRLFLLGRTETVHPGSPLSVAWIKAMDDPQQTRQGCEELFRKAIKYQTARRLDATAGNGCDRHLLGMLCAARELGMEMPSIFLDKAWQLPFVLSTSQTPTRSYEIAPQIDFWCASGGFGPSCKDGYGIAYAILGDDIINMSITCWKSTYKVGAEKFAAAIGQAMEDTKQLLSS